MGRGLDADVDLTEWAGTLKAEGYSFVGRYINPGKSQPLTIAEAKHLSEQGLYIVSLWEQGSPTNVDYFGGSVGDSHGTAAVLAANSVGQVKGTPIYFAVDYDADPADLPVLKSYFRDVQYRVKNAGFRAGVYGSGLVCSYLLSMGFVFHTWLAQSKGWADYETFLPDADIVQGEEGSWHGIDVDFDTSNGDAGGWQRFTKG